MLFKFKYISHADRHFLSDWKENIFLEVYTSYELHIYI